MRMNKLCKLCFTAEYYLMMYGMGTCCYLHQHFSAEVCWIQNQSVVHLENLMYSVWKFFVLFYKIIIVSISKMISIICTCTCGLFLVKMFYWGTFARRPVLFRTCMSNFFSGSATFFGGKPHFAATIFRQKSSDFH